MDLRKDRLLERMGLLKPQSRDRIKPIADGLPVLEAYSAQSDGSVGHYSYRGNAIDFVVIDDPVGEIDDWTTALKYRERATDWFTGEHRMTAETQLPLQVGDEIEVLVEGTMYLSRGKITGPSAMVPNGGYVGYPTDIKHPANIGDGFGWFRETSMRLIQAAKLPVCRNIQFAYMENNDGPGAVWVTRQGRQKLCADGIAAYVGLPPECEAFTAVLHTHKPEGNNYFTLRNSYAGVEIDTGGQRRYYPGLRTLLDTLFTEGFRFITVEYDNG